MKTYRIVQREVVISVFHLEANSKADARKQLTGTLSQQVIEAMGYAEQETESLKTVEVTELEE